MVNPLKLLKLYLRWRPQIEEGEKAVEAAEKGNMKEFWDRIGHIAYPIIYAAAGGAVGAVADYAHTAFSGEKIDFGRMGGIALAGAALALKAYFQQPKTKN